MNCQAFRDELDRALDDGQPCSGEALQHRDDCAACSVWAERQETLVRQLTSPAALRPVTPKPDLAACSLEVVRQDRGRRRQSVLYVALTAAACACVVAWGLLAGGQVRQKPQPEQVQAMAELLALGQGLFEVVPEPDQASPAQLPPPHPLDHEARALHQDARGAGRFVLDCLPRPPSIRASLGAERPVLRLEQV